MARINVRPLNVALPKYVVAVLDTPMSTGRTLETGGADVPTEP